MNAAGHDREVQRNEAFRRFFDEHWGAVRRHIECVVADDGEVAELVSETFLTAWARLKPSRPMGRIWLLRAAERTLKARTTRVKTRRSVLDAVRHGISGRAKPPGYATRDGVLRALGVLTARERRIIMLTYWDGLTVGDVAELMHGSRSRVRKALGRAQERLRTELGLEGSIDGDG